MTDQNHNIRWSATLEPFGKLSSEFVWQAEQNLRFPGQYHDRSTELYYNMYRHYRPDLGRYLTPDPIGLAGGINLYNYAGQNPINEIDPYGLYSWGEFGYDAAQFAVGFGDVVSLGITKIVRSTELYGGDYFTDVCSDAYRIGEWAGFAASTLTGLTGGVRMSLSRSARYWKLGSTRSGLEFSHWFPTRYFKKLGLARFDRYTIWNGNYVSPWVHSMQDLIKGYSGITRSMKWAWPLRQWSRLPLPYKGALFGASWGTFGMWMNEVLDGYFAN